MHPYSGHVYDPRKEQFRPVADWVNEYHDVKVPGHAVTVTLAPQTEHAWEYTIYPDGTGYPEDDGDPITGVFNLGRNVGAGTAAYIAVLTEMGT